MTASSVPDPRDHRELDLPAGAYEVAVAGWPRCDEQQLWDLADHWYAVAESADGAPGDAAERAHHAAARVVATLGGSDDAAAAFTQAWQAFSTSGDVPAATLREVADELGRLAEGYGRDVEAAKLEVWIELGRLAIQLWGDSVGAALTLGEAAPIAAGHLAAYRVALQRVFRRLTAEVDPLAPAAVLRAAGRDATRHLSASLERRRHDEVARHFLHAAHRRHDLAVDAAEAAADARRDGPSALAEHLDLLSARAEAAQAELVQRARAVSDGDPVPATAPDHGGRPTGETRATGPGGLREQPPVPGTALERALPRDAAGRVTRHADPRIGGWFGLLNADGPGTDPGRANNDCDVVLALYETYLLGRPRVAAPRTFDGYAAGEPERPLGGETGGCARVEATTGGRFQGLCPDVGGLTPRDARQAVEHAFTNLHNHLANCGPGAFAFVAAQLEGGATHLWAAVNHDGTILHLDPQSRVLVEGHTPYPHAGRRDDGNVVLMDALVVDGRAGYAPLPFHPLGPFGGSTARPVVPAADGAARVLLAEHVARLRHRVGPAVLAESTALANEIGALIGVAVPVTLRMRSAGALLDEAERSAADPADLVDAVSVRLVVPDTRTLAVALDRTRLRFPDRIRAVPDPRVPPDPGVHVVASVRVDGRPYEFSLRLVAERAADGPPAPTGTTARRATVATLRAATGSDVEETVAEGSR